MKRLPILLLLSATITRAGPLTRAWTRLRALGGLTELYEVSFAPIDDLEG